MGLDLISAIKSDKSRTRAKALRYFYTNCYPQIRDLVVKNNGNETDAEDLFQDGLVIFYENVCTGRFKGESKSETYFYAICRNLWLQKLKKTRKSDDFDQQITLMSEEDSLSVNSSLLKHVFDELKVDCQKLLLAFYFEKKSIANIRADMKMNSEQVVKNKKKRCLQYLMNLIKKKNLTKESFFE